MKAEATKSSKFVGVDLHTNRLTAFYITPAERYSEDFELTELNKFLETIDNDSFVAVEASCNTFKFVDQVREKTAGVTVVNPHKMRLISMVNKKTDKVDAEKLAMFIKAEHLGGEEMIEAVYVPPQAIRNLRSLFVTYQHFQQHVVMIKNRIHALMKQNMIFIKTSDMNSQVGRKRIADAVTENIGTKFQVECLFKTLEQLQIQQDTIVSQIYLSGKNYRKEINILTSLSGISVFTALAVISDIGTVKRFGSAKKFAMYLRSAPGIDSSNESTKIKRTSKFGRKLSITLIIQGLSHFRKSHSQLGKWSDAAIARGKSRGKVRMAVTRKVITQMYHMLFKEEYHYHRNAKLHQEKMAAYDKTISYPKAA